MNTQQERIRELEEKLAALSRELELTNEGVLAVYAELDEAQARLSEQNRLIQEADRLKGEFLANMSHEIRTPMNAIIGLTEVLLRGPLLESQREPLQTIWDAGRNLLALINDILDLSKIEAGMLELESVEFCVAATLESTTELLRTLAQQKNLGLRLTLDPQLPEVILGDPHRLRQVLLNLIGNAIKFTHVGEVLVQVAVTAPEWLTVRVQDTGRGMSDDTLRRLFQPFVQGDGSVTREQGGTGLGLSICKRLLELMRGEIGAESSLGQGSTFWFKIPIRVPAVPGTRCAPADSQTVGDQLPQNARILVVEDQRVNQVVARSQLDLLGLSADFASNGREAIEAVASSPYDLILMDCQMPEMSGFEATRQIRAAEQGTDRHVPIVAMTAGALAGDRQKCLDCGMDDYISKPVEARTLAQVLGWWLQQACQIPSPEALDFSLLEGTYGAPHVPELAQLFVSDAAVEVENLARAVHSRDLAAVSRHQHGLRGLASALRCNGMVAHCDLLREAKDNEHWPHIEHWCRVLASDYKVVSHQLQQRYASGGS